MHKKPIIITFAGVPGSGKSVVADYLSQKFLLPIFRTDQVRSEIYIDMMIVGKELSDDERRAKHRSLTKVRLEEFLLKRPSFILDASVDRTWTEKKEILEDLGYRYLIISFDISKKVYETINQRRPNSLSLMFEDYDTQHRDFLEKHHEDVVVHISDKTYLERISLCKTAVSDFIESI